MKKIEQTKLKIEALFNSHDRAVLAFSGGKESIVLAHMLKPYADRLSLVWVNTGAMFPHMIKFVREYGNSFKLIELLSNQSERFNTAGLPFTVVPMTNTPYFVDRSLTKATVKINDWMTCCLQLRTKPIHDYILKNKISLYIHGQRNEDLSGYTPDTNLQGVEVSALLADWTTQEVLEYVEENGLKLPIQYPQVMDSLECWNCPANLTSERVDFMKKHYPSMLDELRPSIAEIYSAVANELNEILPAMDRVLTTNY